MITQRLAHICQILNSLHICDTLNCLQEITCENISRQLCNCQMYSPVPSERIDAQNSHVRFLRSVITEI
jgi:hypothetical protein